MRLRAILATGLEATADSWPEVRIAFSWVYRAAVILRNKKGLDARGVQRRYRGLLGAIARHQERCLGSRGTARRYRARGAPRSHQSPGGRSRIIAAATSTSRELQNFHSSFAAREYWKRT